MKTFFLGLQLLLIHSFLISQNISNTSNTWYFGNKAGIKFDNPSFPLFDSQLNTQEGVATISDNNGNLLFYTDGITIWDKSHQPMPKGNSSLHGHDSSTQSAIIVPNPGDTNLYYVFTTDQLGGANGLSYSIVDVSLPGNGSNNNPLGDVIASSINISLISPVTEKVIAVQKNNNSGYWLVTHGWNNDKFYAYEITCDGISNTPVISSVGSVHSGGTNNINAVGYMAANIQGTKLALVNRKDNSVEIFDFNNKSGIVSNQNIITTPDNLLYGISFSPDGKLLYIGGRQSIFRHSIGGNTIESIVINGISQLSNDNVVRALQLGPDKNIYVSIRYSQYLGIIENPNSLSSQCEVQGIFLNADNNDRHCRFGLPNIFYKENQIPDTISKTTCSNTLFSFEGNNYEAGKTHEIKYKNQYGCDSIVILKIDTFVTKRTSLNVEACNGEYYNHQGNLILAGDSLSIIAKDINGCDSIHTIIVNEKDMIFVPLEVEVCHDNLYYFNFEHYPVGTDTIIIIEDQILCDSIVHLKVTKFPELEYHLTAESSCFNESDGKVMISVTSGDGPFQYALNNQDYNNDSIYTNLSNSMHELLIKDSHGCITSDVFYIDKIEEINFEVPDQIIECQQDGNLVCIELIEGNLGETEINWSNDTNTECTTYLTPGIHYVEVKNKCQSTIENFSITHKYKSKAPMVVAPNIFSPNDDNINDHFMISIVSEAKIQSFIIQIFDRWGSIVYESNNQDFKWNGEFNGRPLSQGVYGWQIKLTTESTCLVSNELLIKGDVCIVK